MSSSKIGDENYECPKCMNNAKYCGCVSIDEITAALCGPITEDSIQLAVNIADGYLRPVPQVENMLFTKPEWMASVERFGKLISRTEYDRVGLFARYSSIEFLGKQQMAPCTLSTAESAQLEQMFGISQDKISEVIDDGVSAKEFAQRYGGRTKAQVEAQGFDGYH